MTLCRALGFSALLCAGLAQAQTPEALDWLRRIHDATHRLSYSGTFVYQNGNRSETSRITRYVDAGGDIEKVEVMDGVPREIVRTRGTVRCYLPDSRVVKVEQQIDRAGAERGFPAFLPERINALARHYDIAMGDTQRVAGYDCRTVTLIPKDDLRYGYMLYADVKSGMLLKAETFDAKGALVEQFSFTQLAIGNVSRDKVKTRHAAQSWRVENSEAAPASLAGWGLSSELPGFRKVAELRRRVGEAGAVGQVVYSDGLAAVSVFIEPLEGRRDPVRTGLASVGAIHIYTREVAKHMVTVVGEAPAASVQRIANAVEFRRPQ
ncbi:MAG TPA: MucB/RseB C-terminal domain-containing protein [Burkholderiales bacterium]|nr:MucB/RseB C-terminal domain-containing protein [Burkholderiales bacterium]